MIPETNINKNFWRLYRLPLLLAITFVFMLAMSSCSTSKNIDKTHTVTLERNTVNTDSIASAVSDSVSKIETEKRKQLETEIEWYKDNWQVMAEVTQEATSAAVDTSISNDSLRKIIGKLLDRKCPQNTIKVNPDGSVEASGAIKGFKQKRSEVDKSSDSTAKHEEKTVQEKKSETSSQKTEVKTKEKEKETHFLDQWWIWLICLIIGFVIGFRVCWKYKERIKDYMIDIDKSNAT